MKGFNDVKPSDLLSWIQQYEEERFENQDEEQELRREELEEERQNWDGWD